MLVLCWICVCEGCRWPLPMTSQVFPLDYILITVITMYFVVTSMAGIRNMGIWFFWMRVNKDTSSMLPTTRCKYHNSYLDTNLINIFLYFSCTKSDLRKLAPRLFSSSVWFFSWLSCTPATWSTASPHNMLCTAARNILYRWGTMYISIF